LLKNCQQEKAKGCFVKGAFACPEIILLDEPTLGLTLLQPYRCAKTIKKISEQGKNNSFDHSYMYEADELSNRVAIIDNGSIVCLDNPLN
jgi:ABC-2 type transport system ATP-binding protein